MENNNQNRPSSLLDEIIASSKQEVQNQIGSQIPAIQNPNNSPNPQNNKPRDPVSTATIFKFIGALFLTILIFLGLFLAYIVFNPDKASFFVNVFGIVPEDIAHWLKLLIHTSFGIITAVLSLVFIVTLLKTIITPKEQKRRKMMNMIFAIFSGILLSSTMTMWATLYAKIGQTNFTNLGGYVLMYDNDLWNNETMKKDARIFESTNLIGPITIRYDISENADRIQKKYGMKIIDYELNFDDAICENGSSKVDGSDTSKATNIICTFDKIKTYRPTGIYTLKQIDGTQDSIKIELDTISVSGLITTNKRENKDGELIHTFDATPLKRLGNAQWTEIVTNEKGQLSPGKSIREDIYSVNVEDKPSIIGLKIFSDTKEGYFDRIFIVQKTNNQHSNGKIEILQNPANRQEYIFTLVDSVPDEKSIEKVEWYMGSIRICNEYKKTQCIHKFNGYGEWKMVAKVYLIDSSVLEFGKNFKLEEPLNLVRHTKVTNRSGKLLNPEESFDPVTKMYIIKNILPPETITLDARDVVPDNSGYILKDEDITWHINDGRKVETRKGGKIDFTVSRATRYNIRAEYTFQKIQKTGHDDDTKIASDNILLDLERKNLTPILKVTKSSDYVPAKITVDASQSTSEHSEVVKFVFDFGEGRPETIGDAIQTYEYTTSGEKTITVTVIDSNNQRESTKEVIVLKDTPKTLGFTSSLYQGVIGNPVDFEASNTTGQIEDYLWNFGDNTPIEHGYNVTHTFNKTGTYTVILTVKYLDGTERSTRQNFTVVSSLE